MTIYTIMRRPGDNDPADLQAIPEKATAMALAFPPLWLIWHRLWWALVIYGLFTVMLLTLLVTPAAPLILIILGLPGFFLWLEGNQLRRQRLEQLGYIMNDVVEAPDEDVAISRYLSRSGEVLT